MKTFCVYFAFNQHIAPKKVADPIFDSIKERKTLPTFLLFLYETILPFFLYGIVIDTK